MTHPKCRWAILILAILAVSRAWGGPPLREEEDRRARLTADLKKALASETTAAGKVAVLSDAMKAEPSPNVRRVVFDALPGQPSLELDAFLTEVMTGDADAGMRSLAATALGKHGTEKCLPALVKTAGNDPTSEVQVGCMAGRSSARRNATFAIAELEARFPKLADKAAAAIRGLTPEADPDVGPKDKESLADARDQALYQVTRDKELLTPFFDRLRSKDAKVRESGVVAFRFFKLKAAPAEVVAALNDEDPSVRSWAGLVLGEIGDPKTVSTLMTHAQDTKNDRGMRCNVIGSLGQMKAASAADLMRKLLADEDGAVQTAAAIALYRITGEKAKQFPAGYNTD
jgi:HEAT repeat protein